MREMNQGIGQLRNCQDKNLAATNLSGEVKAKFLNNRVKM
jgi:hypothetical protein